ncbi:MAG: hypothetical protein HC797_06205 [Anaerolineales bacterium]|nr:hypothetical protein [Anaerolineales bacterium]
MGNKSKEISANLERAETNLQAAKDLIEKEYLILQRLVLIILLFMPLSALLLSVRT